MKESPSGSVPGRARSCGEGLAEHAPVPAKIAELLRYLAENLEAHVPTIDVGDEAGRREREAYESLSSEYGAVATRLAAAAERMKGYRDLPAARHDEEALAGPGILEAFERLVGSELELVELLRAAADRDRTLLLQARGEGGAAGPEDRGPRDR